MLSNNLEVKLLLPLYIVIDIIAGHKLSHTFHTINKIEGISIRFSFYTATLDFSIIYENCNFFFAKLQFNLPQF